VFPWDTLADAAATARAHPGGIVDLSVGTPVDEVAPVIRNALAQASAAPGYPLTAGTPELRESAVAALARRYGITGVAEQAALPVIGTKELIAWLPTLLGLGADDTVVIPELAYPTYEVGARLAGARVDVDATRARRASARDAGVPHHAARARRAARAAARRRGAGDANASSAAAAVGAVASRTSPPVVAGPPAGRTTACATARRATASATAGHAAAAAARPGPRAATAEL
jgi:hypothetical protein